MPGRRRLAARNLTRDGRRRSIISAACSGRSAPLARREGLTCAEPAAKHAPVRPPEGDPHHILAPSGLADERTRVLKHGDTFAVFDHYGDIKPGGLGEEGLYHEGTRYLSCLLLELDGQPPFFLSSTVRDENDQLSVALTNPDLIRDGRVEMPLGTLAPGRAEVPLARRLLPAAARQEPRPGTGRGVALPRTSGPTSRTSSRSAA